MPEMQINIRSLRGEIRSGTFPQSSCAQRVLHTLLISATIRDKEAFAAHSNKLQKEGQLVNLTLKNSKTKCLRARLLFVF